MAPSTRKRGRSDELGGDGTLPSGVAAEMPKKGTGQKAPKSKASKKKTTKTAEQREEPPPPKGKGAVQQKNPTKRARAERRGNECVRSLTEPMETPVFRPTEEEFANFHEYACKLDKLVGHVGVCKVIPPEGWKARRHDDGVYTLEGSLSRLEQEVQIRGAIQQNAVGGKGVYMNMHQVKRKMTLDAFKNHAMKPENMPPAGERNFDAEAIREQERKFWRNVLFNPPIYGADCPVPKGFRSDGLGGLFDPEICGDWDLAKLPSLLTTGLKKTVPGVNTPYLYIGMYRAAFAWHCEDMDLHSINYLHFGAPKTWYTVPATHGRELEALARQHFPEQAGVCKEFLRHKTNMMEPSILLRAGIPLTRTVQRPGEFIINFPGAYHSGFNNGYNCAESCNFATEYWIPFGVQARPCGCPMAQNSVRIDVDAMLRQVKDVRVKGEQWLECELCRKWRLQPPYMMHLLKEGDAFTCSVIKGLTCSTKEDKWDNDQWEVDGKVQIGVDSTKEDWVMCEQCSKWRKVPVGTCFDLDEAFVCSMLEGCNCDVKEEGWDAADGDAKWQVVDTTGGPKKTFCGEWTEGEESKIRVKFLLGELARFDVEESRIAECKKDKGLLEELLSKVQDDWNERWAGVQKKREELSAEQMEGGVLKSKDQTAGKAARVAQTLWMMSVDEDERKEEEKRFREMERRRKKLEAEMLQEDANSSNLVEMMRQQNVPVGPSQDHPDWRYRLSRFTAVLVGRGRTCIPLGGREAIGDRAWSIVSRIVKDGYHQHSYSILIPLKPPAIEPVSVGAVQVKTVAGQCVGALGLNPASTTAPSLPPGPAFTPSAFAGPLPVAAAATLSASSTAAPQELMASASTGPLPVAAPAAPAAPAATLSANFAAAPQVSSLPNAMHTPAAMPIAFAQTSLGIGFGSMATVPSFVPTYVPPRPPPTYHMSLRLVPCGSKEEEALLSHLDFVEKSTGEGEESCYSILARGIEVACGYNRWADEYRARDAARLAERRAVSQLVSLLSRSVRTCLSVADGGVYDEDSDSGGLRIPQMEGASGPLFMEETITQSVWNAVERHVSFEDGVDGSRRIILFETAPPVPPRPVIIPCASQTLADMTGVGDIAASSSAAGQTANEGASVVANPASESAYEATTMTQQSQQLPTSVSAPSPSEASGVHLLLPPVDATDDSTSAASRQLTGTAAGAQPVQVATSEFRMIV